MRLWEGEDGRAETEFWNYTKWTKDPGSGGKCRIFRKIQEEYGSFSNYLWHWTDGAVIYEKGCSRSELSDTISEDLKKRGMKFVGTTIIYAYLQAVGVIYSHEAGCYLEYKKQG